MKRIVNNYGDIVVSCYERNGLIETAITDGMSCVLLLSHKKTKDNIFGVDFNSLSDKKYFDFYVSDAIDDFVRKTINYG